MPEQCGPGRSRESRLAAMALTDAIGTGLFIAGSAVYFVQVIRLTPAEVGLGLSLAGLMGVVSAVPLGMVADRIGAPRLLVALTLLRAFGFAGYVLVRSPAAFLVLAALLGTADGAVPPLNQAIIGLAVPDPRRVRVMGVQRSIRNVGFTLGAGLAGLALAAGTRAAYDTIFLADAASFLVVAVVVATLHLGPVSRPPAPAGRRPRRGGLMKRYDRVTVSAAAVNGCLSLHMTLLGVGIPLWLVRHTRAPHFLIAILVATNTVLAVLLQVRFTRGADSRPGAAKALRRAGLSLALCCLLLAAAPSGTSAQAAVLLLAAGVALTGAELWQSAGGWGLSFSLAPEGRRNEILALFGMGVSLQQVVVPPLVTVVVFRAGLAGWAALAGAVAACGLVAGRLGGPAGGSHQPRSPRLLSVGAR
jgi:Major Facilitator Superfamily